MYQLLIVDDEAAVLEGLRRKIPWEDFGIDKVQIALSATKALDTLSSSHIDIVITDIRMPGMSGLELIEKIRARWPKTKCVLLTGIADFAYAQEAIKSGASAYLLKPVSDEDVMNTVRNLTEQLGHEWMQVSSYQNAMMALREHAPLLAENLLSQLFLGKKMQQQALEEKMKMFLVPFEYGHPVVLFLIRLEDDFGKYDLHNLSLIEYAIFNITKEIVGEHFELWSCKDSHDYLVGLLTRKSGSTLSSSEPDQQLLERMASHIQKCVSTYLKGKISIVISPLGEFPHKLTYLYEASLSCMRNQIGQEIETVLTVSNDFAPIAVQSFLSLYEPPSLIHLLESGRWEEVTNKINAIVMELQQENVKSHEFILEVFHVMCSAFCYIVHKNGKQLSYILGNDYEKFLNGEAFRNPQQLKEWALGTLERIRQDVEHDIEDNRSKIVIKVQNYVENNISEGVTLQSLSEHLHLHPGYISKLYKSETGETIGDYLLKLRMQRASFLLATTDDKVYEIALKLGYQTTHHFINIFKRYFMVTPQEYRESRAREH
ncbi:MULTISPECIES: response regulator transcription factor [unclassified Paenibacillus]|uniref:response regulator transcription factor n=1 Tax=unclassified Paenibacillus TaxID=185978 RepID=UPI00362F14D6